MSSFKSSTIQEGRAVTVAQALMYLCRVYSENISSVVDKKEVDLSVHRILLAIQSWYSKSTAVLREDGPLAEMVPFFLSIGTEGLDWFYFHSMFTYMDIYQLTIDALAYAMKEITKFERVDQSYMEAISHDLKTMIGLVWGSSQSLATAICTRLSEPGVAAEMVDNAIKGDDNFITCDLEALIGVPGLEEIAANICSSWIEGLEGILRTRPRY